MEVEYKRTEHLTKLKIKMENNPEWVKPDKSQSICLNEDRILFPDGAGLGFSQTNCILPKI